MRVRLIEGLLQVAALLVVATTPAAAHTLGISSGEYRADGNVVHARLAFAVADARTLVPSLDADGDGRIAAVEATRAKDDVAKAIAQALRVEGDGAPCAARLDDAAPTEEDGFVVELSFACADAPREVTVVASFTNELGGTHRHVARTVGAATTDVLLSAASSRAVFHTKDPAPSTAPVAGPPRAPFVVGAIMAIVGVLLLLGRSKGKQSPPPPP